MLLIASLAILPVVLILGNQFTVHPGTWLGDVVGNLKSLPAIYIVLALMFKGGESALTSLAWTHVIRGAYPQQRVPFRLVFASYQGGVALNVFAPAKAGTLATFGLLQKTIHGSRIATIISTFVVNSIAFTGFAIVNILVVVVLFRETVGEELLTAFHSSVGLLREYPALALMLATASIVMVAMLVRFGRSRVRDIAEQIAAGGAILRTPRRYLVCVVLPALGAYSCRLGYIAVIMAGFDIPVTIETVPLMLGAKLMASLVAVTPGGIGVSEAIDIIVMSAYAPTDVIAAASLTKSALFKTWNILFGLILIISVFGWHGANAIFRRRNALADQAAHQDAAVAPGGQVAAADGSHHSGGG